MFLTIKWGHWVNFINSMYYKRHFLDQTAPFEPSTVQSSRRIRIVYVVRRTKRNTKAATSLYSWPGPRRNPALCDHNDIRPLTRYRLTVSCAKFGFDKSSDLQLNLEKWPLLLEAYIVDTKLQTADALHYDKRSLMKRVSKSTLL